MEAVGSVETKPFITLHHISRRFGAVLANRDISLELMPGEVHAIVGENGAGKSTLMKILNGELQPDAGEIRHHGRRIFLRSPREAILAGIGMAHQSFQIFPQLTALENIIAGTEPAAWGWIRRRQANDELLQLCRSIGFTLPLEVPASRLSFAHRQQIEILRLLYRKVKLLILDEPTSLLAPPETERFLDLLRALQVSGHTIVFISHRLREVFAIADRVTVLSRGRCCGTYLKSGLAVDQLVRLVISGSPAGPPGRALPEAAAAFKDSAPSSQEDVHPLEPSRDVRPPGSELQSPASAQPLLELNAITTPPGFQEAGLDRFSLEIFRGEIFGLGGVVGNGQRTLAFVLSGMQSVQRGTIVFSDRDLTRLSIGARIAQGLRWLPANPLEEALLPSRSLWENLLLGSQRQPPLHHFGWLHRTFIRHRARAQLKRQGVVYAALDDPLRELSGGNAQKLALCRIFDDSPRLIILEQPSRGLDLQAQEHLREQVRELNRSGVTFLIISYDLDELLALSHRIGVLYRGKMIGVANAAEVSPEQLGSWMLGVKTRDSHSKT